jgi:hypothetical protein
LDPLDWIGLLVEATNACAGDVRAINQTGPENDWNLYWDHPSANLNQPITGNDNGIDVCNLPQRPRR